MNQFKNLSHSLSSFKLFGNFALKRFSRQIKTTQFNAHQNKQDLDEFIDKKLKEKSLQFQAHQFSSQLDIPKNLSLKNLTHPDSKQPIVLMGLEQRNEIHGSFLKEKKSNIYYFTFYFTKHPNESFTFKDFINLLKPEVIVTQIPPDAPFFIKTDRNFEDAWKDFIKGKLNYKFYINPNPHFLKDINLMNNSIIKAKDSFEIGSVFVYTQNTISGQFEVDNFLTPLLMAYNNPDRKHVIVIGDFPQLIYREAVANICDKQTLIDILDIKIEEFKKKKINFDATHIKPEIFIKPQIQYITEVLKHSMMMGKTTLAVYDLNNADLIEEHWQNMGTQLKNFQDHIQKIEHQSLANRESLHNQVTYVEFLQQHVLLDLILGPFLQNSFIQYNSFPYMPKYSMGHYTLIQQTFIIWDHYYNKHYKNFYEVQQGITLQQHVQGQESNKFSPHTLNIEPLR